MKRIHTLAITAALAALPVLAHAQEQGERRVREHAPSERLLRHREELGLTDDQVRRLQSIGERLREQNRPLVERLRNSDAWREAHARRPALNEQQRAELRRRREGMMGQRDSLRRQLRERFENLNPQQRDSLRRHLRERRPNVTGERREGLRRRMREHRGQRGDRAARLPEELQPVLQQLEANHRAAREQVDAVLTEQQKTKLRELSREHRRGGREGRMRRGPR